MDLKILAIQKDLFHKFIEKRQEIEYLNIKI